MKRSLSFLLLVSLQAGLAGCGGGDGGSSPRTARPDFSIAWGARSREIAGPASALSATIVLAQAASDGTDLVYTVNRRTDPAAYTESYAAPRSARLGTHPFAVRFYSQPDGAGDVVASGAASVTIARNGTGIGTVATTNAVASVAVLPAQTVASGGTLQLAFSARDASGNVVAVTPGSGVWTQVDGTSVLTLAADGVATAVSPGTANVRVTVDGVQSPAVAVAVAPVPVATLEVVSGQTVAVGGTRQLTFVARDASGNALTVPANEATWALVGGGTNLSLAASGLATGLGAGTATVTVSARGVVSAPATVDVATLAAFADPSFDRPALASGEWRANGDVTGSPWSGEFTWGIASGPGSWGRTGHTGLQYAFLQASTVVTSQGTISQTVGGLQVGKRYVLKLWFARRDGDVGGNDGAPIKVYADQTTILEPTGPTGDGAWTQVATSSFVATSASMTFRIEPQLPGFVQDTATLIDDVTLEFAP